MKHEKRRMPYRVVAATGETDRFEVMRVLGVATHVVVTSDLTYENPEYYVFTMPESGPVRALQRWVESEIDVDVFIPSEDPLPPEQRRPEERRYVAQVHQHEAWNAAAQFALNEANTQILMEAR